LRGDTLTFAQALAMGDAVEDLGFAAGSVRQATDRIMAVVAAAQSFRSDSGGRGVGFARARGHRNAVAMVEKQAGVSGPEARRLLELGETLADAERAAKAAEEAAREAAESSSPPDPHDRDVNGSDGSPSESDQPDVGGDVGSDGSLFSTGDAPAAPGPSQHPVAPAPAPRPAPSGPVFAHVAAASAAGQLGAEAATAITRMLRSVADRADVGLMVEAEKDLVFKARHMTSYRLGQVISRWRDRLDAEHLEELAAGRRQRRFLNIGENADGMIRINGQLDPENGAPLVAVMDAMVNQHFRTKKRAQDAERQGFVVTIDERTPGQVCADAMGEFARHLSGCNVKNLPHASAKVIVTMDYDTMLAAANGDSVLGATIEGLSTTPDAGELRRMMARAGLVPVVLGKRSRKLDVGYSGRYFNPGQRTAMLIRDGGCAKCSLPVSADDGHHIVPNEFGGKSETNNGVTLCVRCHHDVHREGWIIVATHTEVWFIPPAHLDPERTPQPGGRRLFDATAVYGDHLPDPADVIARTPIAATTVGDHRRRRTSPTGPEPDRPSTGRASGTSACAMAPDPRSRVLVESVIAASEREGSATSRHERGADDSSCVTGAMSRALGVARRQPPHARAECHTGPRGRHPSIRDQSVPHGLRLSSAVLARGPG
ncbi:HNH endonuclease signature motif containing protein, partial [Demequina sp. NBRC 110051]|uniref:HNH endonuclease n=1 Tax=Demequina sp. NBRC 110051 TaxID=1570340 RepID=UPI00117E3E97